MIEQILLLGDTGTGKSTSLRTLKPSETLIIRPNLKPLPWSGSDKVFQENGGTIVRVRNMDKIYETILFALTTEKAEKRKRNIVVEDFSHSMTAYTMSDRFRARTGGNEAFQRYADLGKDIYKALFESVQDAQTKLDERGEESDAKVVLINHTEEDQYGKAKFKSVGKLLDNHIKPASHFRIVLHAIVRDEAKLEDRYVFQTKANITHEAKSPIGMFDKEYVPNDMGMILDRVRAYDRGETVIDEQAADL